MLTAAILGGILAYFSFFHGAALSTLFIKGSETVVLSASAEFLKATSIECFILSMVYCFIGYFNGIKRMTFVMVQGLLSIFLVMIPYAWLVSTQPNPSLFKIGMSTAWAAVFTLVVCLIYYLYLCKKAVPSKERRN